MAGAAGQLIGGRYLLVDAVGKGGMGQVWRGYDQVLQREVAVKEVLLPSALPQDEHDYIIARTTREARAAARLHHPGIVAVYDAIEHDGVPWIVMEFISGLSLQQVIARDGRLPWQRVAALGVDLAAALAHAHSAKVVHRDLKPANVLLAGHRAVLTDFGVARVLDATTQLTSRGTLIGTPQYMPPEQIEGESIQAPVDLWALGATLYTAVEGCPPFEGTTLTAVLAAILTRPPREPTHAGPMAAALMSLMSKAPERRPDAAGLSGQLSALLRYSRPGPAVRSPSGAAPPSSATVTLASRGTFPQAAVLDGHTGRVHSVAFSPDGTTLATGCDQGVGPDGSPVSGGHRVRLWNLATRTCTAALAGPQGAALSVAFSPDGGVLASGNSNQPVHLWRLTGRFRASETTLSDDTDVLSVAFSPDGRTLATANFYKTIRLWDVATRTCTATLTGHSGWVHSVAFSPDGTMLATGSSDHTVRLWDMHTRACLATLTGHSEIVREVAFSRDGATLASGSVDKTIRLWDTRARTCAAILTDDLSSVFSVAFSPDGAVLASGGSDHAVRLFQVATRACVATLTGHSEPVASVAFSPDGTTLASGGHDKTVRLWQLG
jgi:Protein kinase domain/WD domain, G-beta repeat